MTLHKMSVCSDESCDREISAEVMKWMVEILSKLSQVFKHFL